MKKMVYFLLLSLLRIGEVSNLYRKRQRKEVDTCFPTDTFDESGNKSIKHGAFTCRRPRRGDYFIPENIPSNITEFSLWTNTPMNPTLVKTIDTFKRFSKLTELSIDGYLKFSGEFFESNTKQNLLREQLFRIPTLSQLHIRRCSFLNPSNSELHDSFVLPRKISILQLTNCSDKYFDWKKTTTLKKLIMIENSKLEKVPVLDLGYPSLEVLNVQGSQILIPSDTLAGFCNLKTYLYNPKIYNEKDNYCECLTLKYWDKFLKRINSTSILASNHTKLDCVKPDGGTPCLNYTLEELKDIRNECLSLGPPPNEDDAIDDFKKAASAPFSLTDLPFWIYIILGFFIIILLFIMIMFVAEMWAIAVGPDEYAEEEFESEDE